MARMGGSVGKLVIADRRCFKRIGRKIGTLGKKIRRLEGKKRKRVISWEEEKYFA